MFIREESTDDAVFPLVSMKGETTSTKSYVLIMDVIVFVATSYLSLLLFFHTLFTLTTLVLLTNMKYKSFLPLNLVFSFESLTSILPQAFSYIHSVSSLPTLTGEVAILTGFEK